MNGYVWFGIALLALWALLWLVFKIVTGLVHVIVLVAVIAIVWGLVKRGAAAVSGGS